LKLEGEGEGGSKGKDDAISVGIPEARKPMHSRKGVEVSKFLRGHTDALDLARW